MKKKPNKKEKKTAASLQGCAVAGAVFTSTDAAAIEILRSTGINVIDAALVAKAALEAGRGRVKRTMACISAGAETLKLREKTVTFGRALEVALEERQDRRKRTVTDFRYIANRLIRECNGLVDRRIRCISTHECSEYLHRAFATPRQRNKARVILSSIFTTAIMHGWCAENPIRKLKPEKIVEKSIPILSNEEVYSLMSAAETHSGGSCLAAVAIMLLAGVRPHECERLRWSDIRLTNASASDTPTKGKGRKMGVIIISPRHSKTGGARHVTIHPPLAKILRRVRKADHERICPPNWRRRWSELHKAAGFATWQPDVLRHTFATHHLATFRSYAELQLEMGHRSTELLRTRYVAMPAPSPYRKSPSLLVG